MSLHFTLTIQVQQICAPKKGKVNTRLLTSVVSQVLFSLVYEESCLFIIVDRFNYAATKNRSLLGYCIISARVPSKVMRDQLSLGIVCDGYSLADQETDCT